jgi:glucan biosynthesis protein C
VASTQVVVRPVKELARPKTPGRRDLSIDYLRTTLVMVVVAIHCALPYTSAGRVHWREMILSDVTQWHSLGYASQFGSLLCMQLMFFISGLFVYPALQKHGTARFIRERLLRLGLPFAFSVAFLLPIAMYAPWRLTGHNTNVARFYMLLPTRDFPIGPPWFLWELLFFDLVLVLCLMPLRRWTPRLESSVSGLCNHPVAAFAALFSMSAIVYIPLLRHYGNYVWTYLFTWPFSFQISRIGEYALWFLFGFLVGASGVAEGLLSHRGSLAGHWPQWLLGSILAFNALWFLPRWMAAHPLLIPHALGFSLLELATCAACCFGFLALFRGVKLPTFPWMISLSRSAYVIYLVHYVFISWSQYIVLNRPIHPAIKFLFVFLSSSFLSWLTALALLRVPKLRRIL